MTIVNFAGRCMISSILDGWYLKWFRRSPVTLFSPRISNFFSQRYSFTRKVLSTITGISCFTPYSLAVVKSISSFMHSRTFMIEESFFLRELGMNEKEYGITNWWRPLKKKTTMLGRVLHFRKTYFEQVYKKNPNSITLFIRHLHEHFIDKDNLKASKKPPMGTGAKRKRVTSSFKFLFCCHCLTNVLI